MKASGLRSTTGRECGQAGVRYAQLTGTLCLLSNVVVAYEPVWAIGTSRAIITKQALSYLYSSQVPERLPQLNKLRMSTLPSVLGSRSTYRPMQLKRPESSTEVQSMPRTARSLVSVIRHHLRSLDYLSNILLLSGNEPDIDGFLVGGASLKPEVSSSLPHCRRMLTAYGTVHSLLTSSTPSLGHQRSDCRVHGKMQNGNKVCVCVADCSYSHRPWT